jgi:hypothetical protein
MHTPPRAFAARFSLPLLSALAVSACDATPSAVLDDPHGDLHGPASAAAPAAALPQMGALLQDVKAATARYHSTVQASRAGYAEASHCVASPAGGMGFHWVNQGLVDPVFDPLKPEAVLYEPGGNGQLELVAVEYIVIDVGQPAPTFDGHPFDVGGTPVPVPHWSLHVWLHKDNPNGVFTPFNPDVSCP